MEDIVGNCLVATDVDQFPLHLPADRAKNFVGQNFWARGYYISTMWRDEARIREYIRAQEKEDQKLDQLNMFK